MSVIVKSGAVKSDKDCVNAENDKKTEKIKIELFFITFQLILNNVLNNTSLQTYELLARGHMGNITHLLGDFTVRC